MKNLEILETVAKDDELLEVGRLAIEAELAEMRDSRMFQIRGNGLVIREKDGKDSSIIRFGPETALRIGIEAIVAELKKRP